MAILEIRNVHLPHSGTTEAKSLFDIVCVDGKIDSVKKASQKSGGNSFLVNQGSCDIIDGQGGLLLPSLCHSHVHLDKCFLLDKRNGIETGDFQEALRTTAAIKATFPLSMEDLLARGNRLIRESVISGVTLMRAHVEVDAIVKSACLDAALHLREIWKGVCDVQIAVFAQEPLLGTIKGMDGLNDNAEALEEALQSCLGRRSLDGIIALGSAPYVEKTRSQQLENIRYIVQLAQKFDLELDFHLDYDLKSCEDESSGSDSEPLVFFVLLHLISQSHPPRAVTFGHMTRLSVFSEKFTRNLADHLEILSQTTLVSFVGLPQSDLYMMGRRSTPSKESGDSFGSPSIPRGTVNIPHLRRFADSINRRVSHSSQGHHIGVNVALSINNVANAFTPQGTPDPLSLCPLGVAIYQDATTEGCRILLESVSTSSKLSSNCRLQVAKSLLPEIGCPAEFVLLFENSTVQEAALAPSFERITIKDGRVVANRSSLHKVFMDTRVFVAQASG